MNKQNKLQLWTDVFPEEEVNAGLLLFSAGKAKKPYVDDDGWFHMTVRDERNHKVAAWAYYEPDEDKNVVTRLKCDCETAKDGLFCEHMAAVLCNIGMLYGDIYAIKGEVLINDEVPQEGSSALNLFLDPVHENDPSTTSDHKHGRADDLNDIEDPDQVYLELGIDPIKQLLPELYDMRQKVSREINEREEDDLQDTDYTGFFRPERFREGLNIPQKLLDEAKHIINRKEIEISDIDYFYSSGTGEDAFVGEATFRLKYDFYYGKKIRFSRSRIIFVNCTDYACYRVHTSDPESYLKRSLCVHEVAAILMVEKSIAGNLAFDATNYMGRKLLSSFGVSDVGEHDPALSSHGSQIISIYPEFIIDDLDDMSVSFKIGTQSTRAYKVKDIRELSENMNRGSVMRFGKDTDIRMDIRDLCDEAAGWMRFIDSCLSAEDEENKRMNRFYEKRGYGYLNPPQIKNDIDLYGDTLDRFFETVGDSMIEAVRITGRRRKAPFTLTAKELSPDIRVTIRKSLDSKDGSFLGIIAGIDFPKVTYGVTGAYFMKDNTLCRMPEKDREGIRTITGIIGDYSTAISVGVNGLYDFYSKVVPRLAEIAVIDDPDHEEIQRHIPITPECIFYLDVLPGSIIACRVDVVYGTRLHNLAEATEWEKKSQRIESYRNLRFETDILADIVPMFDYIETTLQAFVLEDDSESRFELLDSGIPKMMEYGEVMLTDRFKRLVRIRKAKFAVGVSVESNIMDLSITSDDLTAEELSAVLDSYHRHVRYHKLKDGTFLKIDGDETLSALEEMMNMLHVKVGDFVKGKMHIPMYRALYVNRMLELHDDLYATRDSRFKKLIKDFKSIEDADYDIPEHHQGVMRKYQETGYRWLCSLASYGFGGILADEMGLGKTVQMIAFISAQRENNALMPSLVVCPASLIYNWAEEFRKFAPRLDVCLVEGTKSEREKIISSIGSYDVAVTSYDLLKRDINQYEDISFDVEVIDEAQYIKNQGTAAAKSVKLIKSNVRFALTGTPIENRLSELWSIFDYLMPGLLYEYSYFSSTIETPVVKYSDDFARERLRRMVSPFILRRKKSDVLKDLPDKLEEVRYAGMGTKQRHLYDAQVQKMTKKLKKQDDAQFKKSRIEILAELTRIRQICCDPGLIFDDYDGGSAKLEACMDLISSCMEEGHKALIFSQFTSMLAILEERLKDSGISYYIITGATPKAQRLSLVNAFNADDTPVFLISLKAGGTGLNLTGADIVIHFDPWWNLAAQNQATDRAHRIGQTNVVTVYRLIVKGTIEEKILEMQERKKQLADDILDTEGTASAAINREDLLELLG